MDREGICLVTYSVDIYQSITLAALLPVATKYR